MNFGSIGRRYFLFFLVYILILDLVATIQFSFMTQAELRLSPYVIHSIIGCLSGLMIAVLYERLRESQEFLKAVIANSKEGVAVFDNKLKCRVWNNLMEEITGIPAAGVIGKRCFDFHLDLPKQEMEDLLKQTLAGNSVSSEHSDKSYPYQKPKSQEKGWISPMFSQLVSIDGRVLGVVVTLSDTTQRRTIIDKLVQSQRMEAIGQMASGIAHDFNNILTGIMGFADLAIHEIGESNKARHYVEGIKQASERAGGLTRQLLAFSRHRVLDPQVLDVENMINGLHALLNRLIGEDIEFSTRLAEDVGCVRLDRSQFEQLLINLIVNARDAISDTGSIVVEAQSVNISADDELLIGDSPKPPGLYVKISVSDTGCGMDTEVKHKIFEPFFTTKDGDRGTGLGMTTVLRIVEEAGGAVIIDSELGQGTTVSAYLPRVATESRE